MAELFGELLKRNNMTAYIGQSHGILNWMWMGGENNSMVQKGQCSINNLHSMRKGFHEIRSASINGWATPAKLTVIGINIILNQRRKYMDDLIWVNPTPDPNNKLHSVSNFPMKNWIAYIRLDKANDKLTKYSNNSKASNKANPD